MKTTRITMLALGTLLFACGGSQPAPATAASATAPAAGGDATAAAPTADVPVSDAEKVVNDMRPDFRKCYADALANDPKIAGQVVVVAKVDAKGAVTSATPGAGATLPDGVVSCITSRVQKAQFTGPGGSGSTLQIPIAFKNQP
jgi:hypothetical protein